MQVSFLGACREVGRSCIGLETNKSKILLDRGIKIYDEEHQQPLYPLPIHGYLDGIILSHAHLDHSGATPFLFQTGEMPVYLPSPSLPILEVLLEDSMKIAQQRRQETYSRAHLKRMIRNVKNIDYKKIEGITSDIAFEFRDAGHILGAATVRIFTKNLEIFYTADFKDEDTRLHKGAELPRKADVVISEATYGDREHPSREKLEKEFVEEIRSVVECGGTVLLPAFAVGRSQEIIQILYANRFESPVYMDGMSRDITEIYLENPRLLRNYKEFYEAMKWVNWITSPKQRETVFNEPSVIVATAGMLSGGPAVNYLLELKEVKNSAIFFTGFQVPGTPGKTLLDRRKFKMNDIALDFSHLKIKYFDFSAHADKNGIQKFLKAAHPKLVFLLHGDFEQMQKLHTWIEEELGYHVFSPRLGEKYNLEDYV